MDPYKSDGEMHEKPRESVWPWQERSGIVRADITGWGAGCLGSQRGVEVFNPQARRRWADLRAVIETVGSGHGAVIGLVISRDNRR